MLLWNSCWRRERYYGDNMACIRIQTWTSLSDSDDCAGIADWIAQLYLVGTTLIRGLTDERNTRDGGDSRGPRRRDYRLRRGTGRECGGAAGRRGKGWSALRWCDFSIKFYFCSGSSPWAQAPAWVVDSDGAHIATPTIQVTVVEATLQQLEPLRRQVHLMLNGDKESSLRARQCRRLRLNAGRSSWLVQLPVWANNVAVRTRSCMLLAARVFVANQRAIRLGHGCMRPSRLRSASLILNPAL
jgi:hypothetical protein